MLIKLIERVRRRATRILMPELEYKERLRRLDLLSLHGRGIKDLTTFYKNEMWLVYSCNIDFRLRQLNYLRQLFLIQ
jgi:hypothetical protein